jgi:hypothetical protein
VNVADSNRLILGQKYTEYLQKNDNNQTYTPCSTLRILNVRWFVVHVDHIITYLVISNALSMLLSLSVNL